MFTFSNISVLELKKLVSVIIISSICRWLTRTRGTAVLIGFSLQKSGSKLYITRYVTKLSVCSAIVLGVLKSLFSKGLPHINNSLFCVSTAPSGNLYKKNRVALTLNLMNTLYVGWLILLIWYIRINIKYVGQLLSKL